MAEDILEELPIKEGPPPWKEPVVTNEIKALVARKQEIRAGDAIVGQTCPKTDCPYRAHVTSGGTPCRDCRQLVKADYYVSPKQLSDIALAKV